MQSLSKREAEEPLSEVSLFFLFLDSEVVFRLRFLKAIDVKYGFSLILSTFKSRELHELPWYCMLTQNSGFYPGSYAAPQPLGDVQNYESSTFGEG